LPQPCTGQTTEHHVPGSRRIWLGSKCSAMIPASGHHASGLTTTDFLAVDPGLTRTISWRWIRA
jgi:hypothetical protein